MYIPCLKFISQNILKKVKKTSQNNKTRKKNRQNSENMIFAKKWAYVEKYTADHLCTNLKNLPWFISPRLQKLSLTYFWLQNKSKSPNCDETETRHVMQPTECKYQVSNWYLKACWKKAGKLWQTDRWTLPWHNTSIFSNGRIKTWFVSNHITLYPQGMWSWKLTKIQRITEVWDSLIARNSTKKIGVSCFVVIPAINYNQ